MLVYQGVICFTLKILDPHREGWNMKLWHPQFCGIIKFYHLLKGNESASNHQFSRDMLVFPGGTFSPTIIMVQCKIGVCI